MKQDNKSSNKKTIYIQPSVEEIEKLAYTVCEFFSQKYEERYFLSVEFKSDYANFLKLIVRSVLRYANKKSGININLD